MQVSINSNISRVGNITSSEIVAMMSNGKEKNSFGKPALTYIEECNMERRLKRSITDEVNARPLSWGDLVEKKVFELLPMDYKLCSNETIGHATIPFWKGSPDAQKFDDGGTVIDVKRPLTLKSFCQLVDCKNIDEVREKHKDGEKYYWQLVSNGILTNSKFAELIVYCPFKSELESIREIARNIDDVRQYRFMWISNASDEELPHLIDGGYYKNLNIILFEIPQSDKDALTERVLKAGRYLETIN